MGTGDPGHSSHEVITSDIPWIKQQVVEELTKVVSYPLSYHYRYRYHYRYHYHYQSLSLSLSAIPKHSKYSLRDLKNNDAICLITCCIVNCLFLQ